MPEQILTTADLIFSETSGNFSHTLSSLKQSRLSIKSRLSSILSDTEYVQRTAKLYDLPLVANERCGSWYIPSEIKTGSVYFKSTDGHQSQWKFSTRRLNLQLLDLAGSYGGCIIVDSTRRGKLMPDALSKTIPIWCAVMNRLLFPELATHHALVVSEQVVSASEASQISQRLKTFVNDVQMLGLDREALKSKVKRPLRPYFVAPEMQPVEEMEATSSAIICCSASRREHGDNDIYVQGAGDDNEHWSRGLTATMFWQHRDLFRPTMSDERLQDVIDELVKANPATAIGGTVHKIYEFGSPERVLSVCDLETLRHFFSRGDSPTTPKEKSYDLLIACDIKPDSDLKLQEAARTTNLLACSSGKTGSRGLRAELAKVEPALYKLAQQEAYKILVCCASGRDLSVGLALAVTCRLEQTAGARPTDIDKTFIRTRLAALTANYPAANPSRATLQSVNAYLMQGRNH